MLYFLHYDIITRRTNTNKEVIENEAKREASAARLAAEEEALKLKDELEKKNIEEVRNRLLEDIKSLDEFTVDDTFTPSDMQRV